MPSLSTTRHGLPLLSIAQAQKEITHNEALVRIDALLHPVAEAELESPPVLADADIGKCWLIAAAPTNEWSGKAGQLAIWIGGGWRYCVPTFGMRLRLRIGATDRVRTTDSWIAAPSIAQPENGSVIDVEARTAITSLLNYLREIGQVAS